MSKKVTRSIITILLVSVMALTSLVALAGCGNTGDNIDFSEMFLVIYDGNGGYLGNKTATTRKLFAAANSKIPKYYADYTNDPYVVSSLGLAMRSGYTLLGWYEAGTGNFTASAYGDYVYLENGVYRINESGEYVLGYEEVENGELVSVVVGAVSAETDVYIWLSDSFVVFDDTKEDHRIAQETYGTFKQTEVAEIAGYQVYDELPDKFKTLFEKEPRYIKTFVAFTEADKDLDRYNLESDYVALDTVMEASKNGEYVYLNNNYLIYDSTNVEHQGLERYTIAFGYKFVATDTVKTPSDLQKYDATFEYWDFEKQRITKDITLYAHWIQKPTVQYVMPNGSITSITTKMNDTNTAAVNLKKGETIGKLQTIPTQSDRTFVGWSKSQDVYDPWNYDLDVFPVDTTILKLYAYMVDGVYTRITSAVELATVGGNVAGNYLLCNDIDLGGASYAGSPLGFSSSDVFTGKFISLGSTISNFKIRASNSVRTTEGLVSEDVTAKTFALFPIVMGATISGVNIDNCTIEVTTKVIGTRVVYEMANAALIGQVIGIDSLFTADPNGSYIYQNGKYVQGTGSTTFSPVTKYVKAVNGEYVLKSTTAGYAFVKYDSNNDAGKQRYDLFNEGKANYFFDVTSVVDSGNYVTTIKDCEATVNIKDNGGGILEYDLYLGGIVAKAVNGTIISNCADHLTVASFLVKSENLLHVFELLK